MRWEGGAVQKCTQILECINQDPSPVHFEGGAIVSATLLQNHLSDRVVDSSSCELSQVLHLLFHNFLADQPESSNVHDSRVAYSAIICSKEFQHAPYSSALKAIKPSALA